METVRKPFQGLSNIIRFNRHFFIAALLVILLLVIGINVAGLSIQPYLIASVILAVTSLIIPLVISWYVYDASGLYQLNWVTLPHNPAIVNINAGFDETSALLQSKFSDARLYVFDFYDAARHTELSIKRARKAYPPHPGTQLVSASKLPMDDNSIDIVFLFLSAHEIRDREERIVFFSEAKRILKPGGKIYVTEHLRDLPNFLAYNIGFFHFHSRSAWQQSFEKSGLAIEQEIKNNPFITTFVLTKNGDTL